MGELIDDGVFRPQPDARPVGEPQAPALGLFGGDLQTLAPPEALDPLVIDLPPARRRNSATLR